MKFQWAISVPNIPNIWGGNFGTYEQNSPPKWQLRAKMRRAHLSQISAGVCSSGPWERGPAGKKRGVPYPGIHEWSTPLSTAHVLRGGVFRRSVPSASFAWFCILIVLLHLFRLLLAWRDSFQTTRGKSLFTVKFGTTPYKTTTQKRPKLGMASCKSHSGKPSYNRCNSKSHTRFRNLIITRWDLFTDLLKKPSARKNNYESQQNFISVQNQGLVGSERYGTMYGTRNCWCLCIKNNFFFGCVEKYTYMATHTFSHGLKYIRHQACVTIHLFLRRGLESCEKTPKIYISNTFADALRYCHYLSKKLLTAQASDGSARLVYWSGLFKPSTQPISQNLFRTRSRFLENCSLSP